MNRKRYRLFARPSFLQGMGELLDFSSLYSRYNHSESGEAADARAIRSDWQAIGDDLRAAIARVKADVTRPSKR